MYNHQPWNWQKLSFFIPNGSFSLNVFLQKHLIGSTGQSFRYLMLGPTIYVDVCDFLSFEIILSFYMTHFLKYPRKPSKLNSVCAAAYFKYICWSILHVSCQSPLHMLIYSLRVYFSNMSCRCFLRLSSYYSTKSDNEHPKT